MGTQWMDQCLPSGFSEFAKTRTRTLTGSNIENQGAHGSQTSKTGALLGWRSKVSRISDPGEGFQGFDGDQKPGSLVSTIGALLDPRFQLSVHSSVPGFPGFKDRCTPGSPVSKIGALLGPRFQRSVHSWVPGFKDRCTPGSPVSKIGAP